ncbi:MAG: PIN domain-containing protein [Nitrososphaerota archaeon]
MNSSEKLKILLDSTYLLPIIGIDVENINEVLLLLKKLYDENKAEYYYTSFNLLEILGKLSRVKYDKKRVAAGLLSIEEEFTILNLTTEGYMKVLDLKAQGYKDIIDLLLYATSLFADILFLTRDYALIDFLKENGEEIKNILLEKEFLAKYG